MYKLVFTASVLLFFTSCEKLVNIGDVPSTSEYPSQLGYEWEYNTTWKLEYYDSSGHIDSSSFQDLGNTIVRVTKVHDTIGIYNNLIRFEDYDLATPQNIHSMWYLNADSGLYAIAYHNPGASQFVVPKQNSMSPKQFKKILKLISISPASYEIGSSLYQALDSIQYYVLPRKVLKYPVHIGARWTELIEPFYRERLIKNQQLLTLNGKNYLCYKVESVWNWGIEFTDYIDFNSGLIMREIIADSLAIINPESPQPVGYFKSTSISRLVRESKP